MTQDCDVQTAWALMKKIGLCMMVTHSGQGEDLRARPMAAHVDLENDAIWFLSDRRREKGAGIEENPNICLVFTDVGGPVYVSLTGHAKVLHDRAKIAELWSTPAKAWWSSEADPNIQIVHVTPVAAEFWDGPGTIIAYAKMETSGENGVYPALGIHKRVAL